MGAFFPTQDVLAKPVENYVWDANSMTWVKETQPGVAAGGLTNAELRATPVPVSGTVTVDTTGLATSAKQDTGNTSLGSIDAKLTNPLPVSGTVTTGGLTDAQLRASDVKITLDGETVPVTGTFFQATQPVSAATLPLPAGAATSAKQDTLLTELQLKADLTETQPVSAASLPLPTGAATSAKQDTLLTELQLKADLTETQPVSVASLPLPTGAATAALQTQPGVDIGDVTVNNAAGAAAVNIQDGGNSITVDGAVTTSGTVTEANSAAIAASLSVMDDWDETDRAKVNPIAGQVGVQGASGTVTALTQRVVLATDVALPAGTNAIGKLAANSGVDIGDVTVDNAGGAAAVNIQDGGNSITVDGTITATTVTAFNKTITYVPVSQSVAGTTVIATASPSNKHKILGASLVMDLTGTLKFADTDGDLTGAMAIVTNGGFVWPMSIIPYQQTTLVNKALNLVTTVGAVKGVVMVLTEP